MTKIILFLTTLFFSISSIASDFVLKSSAFSNQKKLPVEYTCDGENVSPQLSWTGAPKETKSFALILSDPDAPQTTFYHWILYNIPADTKELARGVEILPGDALIG